MNVSLELSNPADFTSSSGDTPDIIMKIIEEKTERKYFVMPRKRSGNPKLIEKNRFPD